MPKLSCRTCGRKIYTVAPLESLFAEERRCPRCGAFLHEDRRETERRVTHRRMNPPNDPGPPKPKKPPKPKAAAKPDATAKAKANGKPKAKPALAAATNNDDRERRVAVRRVQQRRGDGTAKPSSAGTGSGAVGWRA